MDDIIDATYWQPLKTLSYLEPSCQNFQNNELEGNVSTTLDDDQSNDDTIGDNGEILGDSDFRVLQQGPQLGLDDVINTLHTSWKSMTREKKLVLY